MIKRYRQHFKARPLALASLLLVGGVGIGLQIDKLVTPKVPNEVASDLVNGGSQLTIPAQRLRTYPGGQIEVEQQYGPQPGYTLSRISYPSDGFQISGLMATPDTPRPFFGYPVIILSHGYVAASKYRTDGPEYRDYIRAFARAGYVVIKPDFRGLGSSTGVAQSGYYSAADTADILNLAASLSFFHPVDAARVGLFGHSMGGHVALNAVTIAPTRFKAAVIYSAGVGDIGDMFANWFPPSDVNNPEAAEDRTAITKQFGSPTQNPAFWAKVSPITYADQITTPLLLTHGAADRVIPVRFMEQFSAAMTAAGHPAPTYIQPGAGHVYKGQDVTTLIARSLALFNRYVKSTQ
jgi:dipeptidyl aminopeptidase/acylaminoacyl peptidase